MAIKIIKDGVKEFHITCQVCGCEFTYENEDISNSEVICPCCSTKLQHKVVNGTTINPNVTFPMPIWYNQQVAPEGYKIRDGLNQPDNPCDNCPNNPKYLKAPYVGDSPCQWCQKNPWKVTCATDVVNLKK